MRVARLIDLFPRRGALPGSALLLVTYYLLHWLRRAACRGRRGLDLARSTYADDL